jgi:uncharacterized membrane protein
MAAGARKNSMLVLKGILLGLVLFGAGSIVYVINEMRPFEQNKATGLSAIAAWTVFNPLYWAAFVGTLILGCVLVRLGQGKSN